MTTTNVYQGIGSDKPTSRVLQAPGGASNIFGHYQDESVREQDQRRQRETEVVMQSVNRGGASGDVQDNFQDNKDSFAANRQRNHGAGAPFAVSDSRVTPEQSQKPVQYQSSSVGGDTRTAQEMQAANRSRNQGSGAPFATGDNGQAPIPSDRPAHHQQVIGDDYQTPQQRQANNPNKAGNSFSNLFGDSDSAAANGGKARGQVSQFNPVTWSAKPGDRTPVCAVSPSGSPSTPPAGMVRRSVLADDHIKPLNPHTKVSTHNPVTWQAYSNFDADRDHPQHRSRFENFATTRAGTFNPITGQDHNEASSIRVKAPPGGQSSIQF